MMGGVTNTPTPGPLGVGGVAWTLADVVGVDRESREWMVGKGVACFDLFDSSLLETYSQSSLYVLIISSSSLAGTLLSLTLLLPNCKKRRLYYQTKRSMKISEQTTLPLY